MVRKLRSERTKGVNRVGRAFSGQLPCIHAQPGGFPHGRFQHRASVLCAGNRLVPVWRPAGWNQPDLVQPHSIEHFQCEAQMSVMDGIKGAPEDTDHDSVSDAPG